MNSFPSPPQDTITNTRPRICSRSLVELWISWANEMFRRYVACFNKHRVDKPIPVQALIKCKMQDNLEFLQWSKRYWDQHFPGGDYDAMARRKGGAALPNTAPGRVTTSAAGRRGGTTPTTGGPRVARAAGGGAASAALVQENATLKETVVGLERERDFYFSKLRDIELLIQQAVEEDPEI